MWTATKATSVANRDIANRIPRKRSMTLAAFSPRMQKTVFSPPRRAATAYSLLLPNFEFFWVFCFPSKFGSWPAVHICFSASARYNKEAVPAFFDLVNSQPFGGRGFDSQEQDQEKEHAGHGARAVQA